MVFECSLQSHASESTDLSGKKDCKSSMVEQTDIIRSGLRMMNNA